MMKFLMLFMVFFMFNLVNKLFLQMFYQNVLFLVIFFFFINFPLNSFNFYMKMYYMMGMDFYSFGLIILSVWVMCLMIMMSEKNLLNFNYVIYFYIMNLLLLFLVLCFMMVNLMMFYMFFEASLLPIFLLIMGWGFQIDRMFAGFYMMLYTLFGSLPLLLMILLMYKLQNSLMMNLIELSFFNLIIYILMILAFLIKMPMFFIHLWLPKAHVEAPLSGSMILAGVMLKLGSYGLLRFMMMMMKMALKFNKYLIMISLMGGIFSSLMCLYQMDMKMLVAYSSVVHMSILMSGMMTLFNWGFFGGMLMMIAHGLCSSGLFCLVNFMYLRFKSRSLLINKGLINLFPSLSLLWFLMCSSNLSFPPSMNLFGEIMLLNSLMIWKFNLIYILMILMFLSASYSLYLYSYSQHGEIYFSTLEVNNIMILEYMILILHWVPLNFLFLMFYLYL